MHFLKMKVVNIIHVLYWCTEYRESQKRNFFSFSMHFMCFKHSFRRFSNVYKCLLFLQNGYKLTLIIELEKKLFFETPCTLYLIIFPLPAPRCSLTRAWSPSIHLIRGRAHHCHEVGDLVPHVALPLLHWQIIVLECLIVGGAVRLIWCISILKYEEWRISII